MHLHVYDKLRSVALAKLGEYPNTQAEITNVFTLYTSVSIAPIITLHMPC